MRRAAGIALTWVAAASCVTPPPDGPPRALTEVLAGSHDVSLFKVPWIETIRISPDARRAAWMTKAGTLRGVHCDGRTGPAFRDISRRSFHFGPEGKRLAYVGLSDESVHVVVDLKPFGPFQDCSDVAFSHDG